MSSTESNSAYAGLLWFGSYGSGSCSSDKENNSAIRPIRSISYNLSSTSICEDELACNFEMGEPICEYPEQGYDCSGRFTPKIGDLIDGGIVFDIDSTGNNLLLVDTVDYYYNPMGVSKWGWTWPTLDELQLIYNQVGHLISKSNIYVSSTIADTLSNFNRYTYYDVNFNDGTVNTTSNNVTFKVRLIKTFTHIVGCSDVKACNFVPGTHVDDNSCEYPSDSLNCSGDPYTSYEVGEIAEGGIVFYVDSTGYHGLVAGFNDLDRGYSSCANYDFDFITSSNIGYGHQNTIEVSEACAFSDNTDVIASQAVLNYETEGYSDWYLPSKDELYLMIQTLGKRNNDSGNIGNFNDVMYSTSTTGADCFYGYLYRYSTSICISSHGVNSVRPIRSF